MYDRLIETSHVQKIEWKDLNLSIQFDCYVKNLLSDICGHVSAGQLLAIMGPTGCGKTSLLNVLAARTVYQKNIHLTGSVLFDNQIKTDTTFNKQAVCVMQDDMLFSHLTVRETFAFAAGFYMPLTSTEEEINLKVEDVINNLSLWSAADTLIGSYTLRGISGGEYKRVLIGKELMKNPSVLFLDEPTSGLDAFQAQSVMESLKAIATDGRIVISVIHQPRSSIFALFDQMLLLSEGRTMYFGPAADALSYLVSLGLVCPFHYNPADFFLDILSVNKKSPELETSTRARLEFIAEQWKSKESKELEHLCCQQSGVRELKDSFDYCSEDSGSFSDAATNEVDPQASSTAFEEGQCNGTIDTTRTRGTWNDPHLALRQSLARWWVDFRRLMCRAFLEKYRDHAALIITTGTVLFFAVLLSLIYHGMGHDQKSIQDRTGLLYFVLVNQCFTPLVCALCTFPFERRMVSREIWGGAYQPSAYYAARVLSEMPLQILLAVVYSTVIYWATNLNPLWDRYLVFLLLIVLTTLVSLSLGFLVSSVASTTAIAEAVGSPLLVVFLLFGGFYINKESLPYGSQWMIYTSLVYWGFQGLAVNEFNGMLFDCSTDDWYCVRDGETVLRNLSFSHADVRESIGALVTLFVVFMSTGYFGILYSREKYQKIVHVAKQTTKASSWSKKI